MALGVAEVEVSRRLLIVEDEERSREALASMLKRRGYEVQTASNGATSVRRAGRGSASVVLMDLVLGNGMDGIEAARLIQRHNPLTAFIVITAHRHEESYHARAKQHKLRIEAWVDKPLDDVDQLLPIIEKALRKVELLAHLERVRVKEEPLDSLSYLRALADFDPSIRGLANEVRDELVGSEAGAGEQEAIMQIRSEIDGLYDEFWRLVGPDSDPAHLARLRERLRELQNQEADIVEQHAEARFSFDPSQGRQLIEETRRRLGGK
jgi:CheY-like chemotaxis protein